MNGQYHDIVTLSRLLLGQPLPQPRLREPQSLPRKRAGERELFVSPVEPTGCDSQDVCSLFWGQEPFLGYRGRRRPLLCMPKPRQQGDLKGGKPGKEVWNDLWRCRGGEGRVLHQAHEIGSRVKP